MQTNPGTMGFCATQTGKWHRQQKMILNRMKIRLRCRRFGQMMIIGTEKTTFGNWMQRAIALAALDAIVQVQRLDGRTRTISFTYF